MNKYSLEDEAPDKFTRNYGIGGNDDSNSDPMSWWGKVIWLATILGSSAILYELLHGNRAITILLGCAIAIFVGLLWKDHQQ